MIEKLTGTLTDILPTNIVVEVGGVGYGVEVPLNYMTGIVKGDKLSIWIHTYLRENIIKLFGFPTYVEKRVFEILLEISGVGPKVALAIMSSLSVSSIKKSVQYEDSSAFIMVPGVGPRLAERILVELKPRLEKIISTINFVTSSDEKISDGDLGFDIEPMSFEQEPELQVSTLDDVKSALENLGFKEKNIAPVISSLKDEARSGGSFQDLLKKALSNIRPLI